VTNDLERRVSEHKQEMLEGFTRRYQLHRLVYCEDYPDPLSAIAREKRIKGWVRRKKLELIREQNPLWSDLAEGWFREGPDPSLRSG
jgi:putative endonuclease